MNSFKKKFGQRVKELRKMRGLTQEQIAEIVNIEPPNISKMENGLHFPQPENIEKLSKALNVDIKDLFDFSHIIQDVNLISNITKELKNLSSKELRYIFKTIQDIKLLRK